MNAARSRTASVQKNITEDTLTRERGFDASTLAAQKHLESDAQPNPLQSINESDAQTHLESGSETRLGQIGAKRGQCWAYVGATRVLLSPSLIPSKVDRPEK